MKKPSNKCIKCKVIKETSEFYKDNRRKDGVRAQCKVCCNKYATEYRNSGKAYLIYYLPNEHYIGVTKERSIYNRMSQHKAKGNNIDGWRVLYASENRAEAYHHEAMYHGVLGFNGLNYHK